VFGIESDIVRRAVALAVAVGAYGVSFGVLCGQAGLSVAQAAGFSTLVFAGSSQLAAVGVLLGGGSIASAVISGLLLNLRTLGFGLAIAPVLGGPLPQRLLASQLMIDESAGLGLAEDEPQRSRQAYWAGGIAVFITWNAATLIGVSLAGALGDRLETIGLDAAFPAAFLALLAPRLRETTGWVAASLGALVALALIPFARPGIPIVAAAGAAVAVLAAERLRAGR
jgi:predicted branched-subunit amino acid permease